MSCCAQGKAATNNNPILAKGWEEFWSSEYQLPYYFHKKLKKTQWEHPGYSLPNGKPIKLKKIVSLKEGIETKKSNKKFECTFVQGPLGLKLREDMDVRGNMIVEVWDVVPEGQADNSGRINVKDRLSKIGGRDCNLMELPEILRSIKTCGRPLTLEFCKPPTKAEEDALNAAAVKRAEERKRLEEEERKERERKELLEKERQLQEQKELEAKELRKKRMLEEEKQREKEEQEAQELREKEEQEARELREKEEQEAQELREKEEQEAKAEQEARELKEKQEREAEEAERARQLAEELANENGERETFTFPEGPMGMILGDGENDEDGSFVELISKVDGSKAEEETTLLLGDRIVKVASTPVKGLDFEHVMTVLKSAERPVELTFLHPTGNIRRSFYFHDGPMGMTLEDDTDAADNDIVKLASIKEESQAAQMSNLEVNDCIIAIGGESVAGFHFDKIMSILTASPRPVKLTFMRPPKVEEYVYTFEAGPIGLVLGDSVNDRSGKVFVGVVSKKPGSAADKYPDLKENDQITHIGDQKVKGLDFAHVMEILKEEPRPMNLTFIRPQQVEAASVQVDDAAGQEKKAPPPPQPASAPQAEPAAAEAPSTPSSGEAKPQSTPQSSTTGAAKKRGSMGGGKRSRSSTVGGKKTPRGSAAGKTPRGSAAGKTPRGSSGGKKRTSSIGGKSAGAKSRGSASGKKRS